MKKLLLRLLALVLAQCSLATLGSTTLTVATTVDGTNTSPLTLRAAIAQANNDAVSAHFPYLINVPAGTYNLTLGELDIGPGIGSGLGSNVMIIGASTAQNTVIQQNGIDHVFVLGLSSFAFANLTIAGGNDQDTNSTAYGSGGGAIDTGFNGTGSEELRVTNCIFMNNTSEGFPGSGGVGGGAISCFGGSVNLIGCTFTNNTLGGTNSAEFAGGAIIFSAESPQDTLTAVGCTFENNSIAASATQGGFGGAVAVYGSGQVVRLTNCIFNANSLASGGYPGLGGAGLYVPSNSVTSIIGCTFVSNHLSGANSVGGAVWLSTYSSNTLQYCRFAGNSIAPGGSIGTNLFVAANSGPQAPNDFTSINDNWWAANTGPPIYSILFTNASSFMLNDWLVLTNTASASTIVIGYTNTLTASFLVDSAGNAIAPANLMAFTNAPVTFGAIGGTISAAQPFFQASGTATATFTGNSLGMGSGSATVDGVTVSTPIQVIASAKPTSVAIRSVNPTNTTLDVAGVSGLTYHVLASDDMKTWVSIGSVLMPSGGSTNFVDGNVSQHTNRFYVSVYP